MRFLPFHRSTLRVFSSRSGSRRWSVLLLALLGAVLIGTSAAAAIFAPNSPSSGPIVCDSSAPATVLTDTVTAGGSSLSYDAGADQYIYVWKTESSWAGTCRQLVVQLNDGSIHRANFRFR